MNASLRRLAKKWFSEFWEKKPPKPPYNHICQIGDPILKSQARAVPENKIKSKEIQDVVHQMTKVMRAYRGVGLAAPQIGLPLRIIVMEMPEKYKKYIPPESIGVREVVPFSKKVFINPEMQVLNQTQLVFPEACESLVGFSASVARFYEVEISGYNEQGEKHAWRTTGWAARIIQHEIDHLNGKFYTDRMDIKTFQNDCWYWVNLTEGKYRMRYA